MCLDTQVLFSEEGYAYLDVRPTLEYEEVGRVKGSVNIPMVNLKRVYDPEQKKKVMQKEENDTFTDKVSPPPSCAVECFDGEGGACVKPVG